MTTKQNTSSVSQNMASVVQAIASSCQVSAPSDRRITEGAPSTKRNATRGRPFARTELRSTRPKSNYSSNPSQEEEPTRPLPCTKKPLSSVICSTCEKLTGLHSHWKTSKCRQCKLGGQFWPHYALSVVTAGNELRAEQADHMQCAIGRLSKSEITITRDLARLRDEITNLSMLIKHNPLQDTIDMTEPLPLVDTSAFLNSP